jgi:hypothetical protein
MAPSSLSKSKRRQKERRETRIADKALLKEQQQQQQQSNGKKKNSKKSSSNKNDNNTITTNQIQHVTVENLLAAAERILTESDDSIKVIELYNAAEIIIKRSQLVQNDNNMKQQMNLYLDILERRAEQYMNIGSIVQAIDDYKQAILIATTSSSSSASASSSSSLSSEEQLQQKCTLLERMSTYSMNLGQIYEGDEALQSYMNGIHCLEQAIGYQQTNSLSTTTTTDVDDEPMNDTPAATSAAEDVVSSSTSIITLIDLQKKLISAYCAAGELYMTDLCDNIEAEEQCELLLQKALQVTIATSENNTEKASSLLSSSSSSSSSIEALQLAASHRLSQNRPYDAIQYILQAYDTIRIGCEALSTLVGLRDDTNVVDNTNGTGSSSNSTSASAVADASSSSSNAAAELMNLPHVQALPTFEFRCQTVKLLLECSAAASATAACETMTTSTTNNLNTDNSNNQQQLQHQQNCSRCLDNAIDVLGSLLAENDEDSQVYSLLGDVYHMKFRMEHENDNNTNKNDVNVSKTETIVTNTINSTTTTTTITIPIDLPIYYWTRAIELLRTVLQTLERNIQNVSTQDEEDNIQNQIDSIVCILEEIQSKIIDLEQEYPQQSSRKDDTDIIITNDDRNNNQNKNNNDCEPMEE